MPKVAKQSELARGVPRQGRSLSRQRQHKYKFTKLAKTATAAKKVEAVKETRFYAADDVATPFTSRKANHKPTKLRASIAPGSVLIILAGRFKGKRVVFLKQLESGLLLVTGPYKINGVPLRRVNQAYVIATSTSVDISKVNVSDFNDEFFAKAEEAAPKKDADTFFAESKKAVEVSEEKKAAQKKVDAALLPAIAKVANLKAYLNARFSLTQKDRPHLMKF
jgi:large subunit ribosomal protein L6e